MMSLWWSGAVMLASTAGVESIPDLDLNNLPEELQSVSRGWLSNSWPSNLQEAQLVIEAYQLEEKVIPAFTHLFYLLLVEEYEYEMAYLRSIDLDTPPEEALRKSIEFVDKMPTGPDRLCDVVESLLEQGDHSMQRVRFAELRARRDGLIWLEEDIRLSASSLRRRLKRHRRSRTDLTAGSSKPIPKWAHAQVQREAARELEHEQLAEDALATAASRRASRNPNGSTRHRPAAASLEMERTLNPALARQGRGSNRPLAWAGMDGETPDPLIAAHEDSTYQSWKVALRSCLARPGLSDTDRRSARRAFDQCWSKAQAYRRIHKADYEHMASLTSRKAHRERLLVLDKPLEGLFAELSQRLAAIGPQPVRTSAALR